jgi:hypothetical protein
MGEGEIVGAGDKIGCETSSRPGQKSICCPGFGVCCSVERTDSERLMLATIGTVSLELGVWSSVGDA